MSHFYGVIEGQVKNPSTQRGSKKTGLRTVAASWNGAIEVLLVHVDGRDEYIINEMPWKGEGQSKRIAHGVIGE